MKIGIISINMYSKGLNFACPLHTYAFQQFLSMNGFDSTVIDYKPVYYDNFDLRDPYHHYVRRFEQYSSTKAYTPEEKKVLKRKINEMKKKRDSWEPLQEERAIRYDKFENFIQTRYKKTDICYDSDLLEVWDPDFDCYICATDVIWKNQPNCGYDRGYFLGSKCMENKWKISYAASRGFDLAQTEDEHRQFFQYMKDIDYISVREKSLKEYIEQNTDRKAQVVLDPVLLHTRDFYDDIAVKPKEEHYMFLYYVMEKATDTIQQAVNYAREHHLKIIEVTDLPLKNGRLSQYTDVEHELHLEMGIEEWLGYIAHADCVFTNSFHACCFCILFEKKFFVGHRNGDKVSNVLDAFGLSDRKITLETDLSQLEDKSIDYGSVRTLLEQRREESKSFILNALREIEGKRKEEKDYSDRKKDLTYKVLYNSQIKSKSLLRNYDTEKGIMKHFASGTWEYWPNNTVFKNDGSSRLLKNGFASKNHQFIGWRLRIRIDNRWFWYMNDGSLCLKETYDKRTDSVGIRVFQDEEAIPYIPVNRIATIVAEAAWKTNIFVKVTEKLLSELYKIREKISS